MNRVLMRTVWLTNQIHSKNQRDVDHLLDFYSLIRHHYMLPHNSINIGRFAISSSRWMYEKNRQSIYVCFIYNQCFSYTNAVNALKEIATTLGIKRLNLSAEDPCNIRTLMIIQEKQDVLLNSAKNNSIVCDCSFNNNMTCHIKVMWVLSCLFYSLELNIFSQFKYFFIIWQIQRTQDP